MARNSTDVVPAATSAPRRMSRVSPSQMSGSSMVTVLPGRFTVAPLEE